MRCLEFMGGRYCCIYATIGPQARSANWIDRDVIFINIVFIIYNYNNLKLKFHIGN